MSVEAGNGIPTPTLIDKASERDAVFWEKIALKTKVSVPVDLQTMLTALGCNSEPALKCLDHKKIDSLQAWARRSLVNMHPLEKRELAFGVFRNDPKSYEFSPGHRATLLELAFQMSYHVTGPIISPSSSPKLKRPKSTE